MNNKGSTMVLLVIVIALVIVLGASVLNVAVKQYSIKKFNTDSKQSFYMSETGLNEAYVRTCVLIDESIVRALQMAIEHLLIEPPDEIAAKNIFITNYKTYLKSNIEDRIETSSNPSVIIWNDSIVFKDDVLTVILKSTYRHENSVEMVTGVELVISVPDFSDVIAGTYAVDDYIEFENWNS